MKRIEYIDIAKGVGIILVVIGHCIDGNGIIGKWISSFHMPLFFFISGLCFSNSKYPTFSPFAKKRLKQLLLPCLYLTLLITILEFSLIGKRDFSALAHHLPGALWFIPVLFFTELFYYVIKECKFIYLRIVILICCMFIGSALYQNEIYDFHSLTTIFSATVFYGVGNISKSYLATVQDRLKNKSLILIILSVLCLSIPFVSVFSTGKTIGMSDNHIDSPIIYSYAIALIGILGIFLISNASIPLVRIKSAITFLGRNTLIIMSIHMFLIGLSSRYIKPIITNILLYKITEQVFIWLMLLICIQLINKRASWIISK